MTINVRLGGDISPVRFVCLEPREGARERVLTLPAKWAHTGVSLALMRCVVGSILMVGLWLLVAFVFMFIPFVGPIVGMVMLFVSPVGFFVYAYDIWRSHIIACVWCPRLVHVGPPFDTQALCACGARYRHAKFTERSVAKADSNVSG